MIDKVARVSLRTLPVQKSYTILADELRRTILEGQLDEGTHLPSERELVTQTGINRSSVREALRMLEVEGLLRSTPGRYGGNVVAHPDNDSMAHFVGQFIRIKRIPLHSLQQARMTIEPALARLAAESRDEEDLAEIDRLTVQMADGPHTPEAFAELNARWHNAVATASKNDLLAALQYAMSRSLTLSTSGLLFGNLEIQADVCHVHKLIAEAIRAQDREKAEGLMLKHVEASGREVESRTPESDIDV
jgi:DNA-binding FadR family transcriptional regulator